MRISDENPFRKEDPDYWNNEHSPKFNLRKWFNLLFGGVLVFMVWYSLSQRDFSFNFSIGKLKEVAKENTPAFTPIHALAPAHNSSAYVWVFSFARDSSVYLSVINPIEKKLISHQLFPYSNCKSPSFLKWL